MIKPFPLLLFFLISLIYSCKTPDEIPNDTRINYGNNIIILVDLSNRILRNKSVEDTTIIFTVLNKLKPLIEKSIELGIHDKLKIYSINQFVIDNIPNSDNLIDLDIDLADFNNKLELSNYLYGRVENDYDSEILKIENSVKKIYEHATHENLGADVWYYFNDHLTTTIIDTTSRKTTFKKKTYISKRKNKIILLTDGYIEAGRYGNDITMAAKNNPYKTKYLSSSLTEKIRNEFNSSTYNDLESFVLDKGIGLIPVKNPLLTEVELLVLEVDDRTIKNGVTTKSPTDSEIIKLSWKNWLNESGISKNNFSIHDAFKSQKELELLIDDFLK